MFVPAVVILVVAFVISGLPEFLSFISFEVLFALALLKLLSGAVTGLFAVGYFIKTKRSTWKLFVPLSFDVRLEDALLLPQTGFNQVEYEGWSIESLLHNNAGLIVRIVHQEG